MKPAQKRKRHRVESQNLGGALWNARNGARSLDVSAKQLRQINKPWALQLATNIESAASRAWDALDSHLNSTLPNYPKDSQLDSREIHKTQRQSWDENDPDWYRNSNKD